MRFSSFNGGSYSLPAVGLVAVTLLTGTALMADQCKQTKPDQAKDSPMHSDKWVVSPDDFFPIGTWIVGNCIENKPLETEPPERWKGFKGTTIASDLVARGIDTVLTCADTRLPPDSPKPNSVRSLLNEADKRGLKIILIMQDLINPMRSMDHAQLMTEGKARIAPFVKEAMKHKSLIAYYLVDEPQDKAGYDFAAGLKQIFTELDPSRFSFTAGVWPRLNIKTMMDNVPMPVAMPESYPLWNYPYHVGIGDFRYQLFTDEWYTWEGSKNDAYDPKYIIDLADAYDVLQDGVGDKSVMWPLVAVFQEPHTPPNWDWRPPTPEEARCMTGIALAKGAKGIVFFAYCLLGGHGDYPILIPEIESQSKRLHKLGPVLLKCSRSKATVEVSGGGSEFYKAGLAETFVGRDGNRYVLVVNRNCVPKPENDLVSVTLDKPKGIETRRIRDIEKRAPVTGSITDQGQLRIDVKLSAGDYALIKLGK